MLKVLVLLVALPLLALVLLGSGALILPYTIAQGVFGLFGGILGLVFGLVVAIVVLLLVGSLLGATAVVAGPFVLLALLVAFVVVVLPLALPLALLGFFIWLIARAAQSQPAAQPALPAPGN